MIKNITQGLIVPLLLCLFLVPVDMFAYDYKVFILSGQSNMNGVGIQEGFLSDTWYHDNVMINVSINGDYLKGWVSPIRKDTRLAGNDATGKQWFGPEVGISDVLSVYFTEMDQTTSQNTKIVLIKVAWGGSGLKIHWLDREPFNGIDVYERFQLRVNQAIDQLNGFIAADPSSTAEIAGFIWMQGEADATNASWAANYSNNLAEFVNIIRSDENFTRLEVPGDSENDDEETEPPLLKDVPFIYGTIKSATLPYGLTELYPGLGFGPNERWVVGKLVQVEQYRAQSKIPNCRCTDQTAGPYATVHDMSMWNTDVNYEYAHYNAPGIYYVGLYLGTAMREYLEGITTPGCAAPSNPLVNMQFLFAGPKPNPAPPGYNLEVYTLDEGYSEANIVKPRFYVVNNDSKPLSDFTLKYYFSASIGKTPVADAYWAPGCSVTLEQIDGESWCAAITFTGYTLPAGGRIPENSGFIIGIHYSDWSVWDKTDDFSQPAGNSFGSTDKVAVFDDTGNLVFGSVPE